MKTTRVDDFYEVTADVLTLLSNIFQAAAHYDSDSVTAELADLKRQCVRNVLSDSIVDSLKITRGTFASYIGTAILEGLTLSDPTVVGFVETCKLLDRIDQAYYGKAT